MFSKQLNGAELQFKKLIAGTATTLVSDGNAITINPTATGLPQLQVFADNNNITLNNANTSSTLAGGNLVTTNLTVAQLQLQQNKFIDRCYTKTRC